VGIIEWGVGGAIFSAEVDWNQGVYFAVSASWVRVSARVESINSALVLAPIDIVLKAAYSYGNASTLGQSSPLRRTIDCYIPQVPVLAPGGSFTIRVPSWAVGFAVLDGGGAGGPIEPDYTVTIQSDNVTGATVYKWVSRKNTAVLVEGGMPLPPNARFLTLLNNNGVAMSTPKVLFNLAF
jgi:hypothetical protein